MSINFPTNEQFRTSIQSTQSKFVKIELLNYNFNTVEFLEGVCTGGSITIDANSDIRRTGSISIIVKDSSFEVSPNSKIWLDKYVRLWVGIKSLFPIKDSKDNIVWNNCGLFVIDAPSYSYDLSSNNLTISLLDLMSQLTGARNGYLKGVETSFKAGQKIRDIMIAMLKLGGFDRFLIETPDPDSIPMDMEFSQGSTIYDVLKRLKDIYADYEMFFDVNGVFVYQKISKGFFDPVVADDSLWDSIVLNENINVDFQNVRNVIEIYGRTHNPARFSTETTFNKPRIHLTIADVYHYFDDLIYGFTLTDNKGVGLGYTPYLQINELESLPIYKGDGKTPAKIFPERGEVYYCVQYKGTYWQYLGHLQAHALVEEVNPNSPFYVGTIGKIYLPLFGGEYENIFSDELAYERGEYELYLHSNMNNTITLSCVPVYWLDVNTLVLYTSRRNKKDLGTYLIKSINMGLSQNDNMTINLMKVYFDESNILENTQTNE